MSNDPQNGGIDTSLYPVAVLIDELRHDDLRLRLNSIKNLGTIATALGPERTREELIPFLQEILIDDDDEVLVALAEQLGQSAQIVGGSAYVYTLINALEELANVEEIAVRDKATEALRNLVGQMTVDHIVRHFSMLIHRLAGHDWYTSRISACSLFAAAIERIGSSSPKQEDLLRTYFRLCGDDTPMVRRQAANVLGDVAAVLDTDAMKEELLEIFRKLSKDEQDSVRILAINNCMALGKLPSYSAWEDDIIEVVKSCTEDKSWRVRYMVADKTKELCDVFESKATEAIVPLYLKLLQDMEVEVRTVAAVRLCDLATVQPTKGFLDLVLPAIEKLTLPKEQSQHVRASLAGSLLGLTPIFGQQVTVEYLTKIFLQLITDDSPDVRLKLICTLSEMDITLSADLLTPIKELAKDRQWRVRLSLLDYTPSLAKHLGEQNFTKEFGPVCWQWLTDPVYSVRDAATGNFKQLLDILGESWAENQVMPQLVKHQSHSNYLYRISTMNCAGSMAEGAGAGLLERHLVPMVVQMSADPVPNVRFNVAKVAQAMHKACKKAAVQNDELMPCLRKLAEDKDPDVKFYASTAIAELSA